MNGKSFYQSPGFTGDGPVCVDNIKIVREQDTHPDLSDLGEYSDRPAEHHIDRQNRVPLIATGETLLPSCMPGGCSPGRLTSAMAGRAITSTGSGPGWRLWTGSRNEDNLCVDIQFLPC